MSISGQNLESTFFWSSLICDRLTSVVIVLAILVESEVKHLFSLILSFQRCDVYGLCACNFFCASILICMGKYLGICIYLVGNIFLVYIL